GGEGVPTGVSVGRGECRGETEAGLARQWRGADVQYSRRFYGGPAGLAEGVRHTAQAAAGAHGDPTGQSTDLAGGRGRFHDGGGGAPPVWAVRRLMQCCWRRRTR